MEINGFFGLMPPPSGMVSQETPNQAFGKIFSEVLEAVYENSGLCPENTSKNSVEDYQESLRELLLFLEKEELPLRNEEIEYYYALSNSCFNMEAFLNGETAAVNKQFFPAFSGFFSPGLTTNHLLFPQPAVQEVNINTVMTVIKELLSQPAEKMADSLQQNREMMFLIRLAKLFQLTGNERTLSGGEKQLPELLAQLSEKIAAYLNKGRISTRDSYLKQTFSKTAEEINNRSEALFVSGKMMMPRRLTNSATSLDYPLNQLQWSKPEQMVFFNQPAKETHAAQFIEKFADIMAKSHFINAKGVQRLNIQLVPEHLGRMRIELIRTNGEMTARILTATGFVKEVLESRLPLLKEVLIQQNIPLDKIEVVEQLSGQDVRFAHQDQHSQNRHHDQRDNPGNGGKGEREEAFTGEFTDFIISLEV